MCQMSYRDSAAKLLTLVLFAASLQLMSSRENQHDIFGGHPTIFRNVTEPASQQYQFTPAVFGLPAQQRMIREQLESSTNAEHPLTRDLWVVVR